MYPEDRVLIAYLPDPADFTIIRDEGWYRIPERHAPKGLHAEYYAFYFGNSFGSEKWAIHYYARQLGFELLKRIDLLPNESDHPHADDNYYKVTLGSLKKLAQPITSLRLRRITFLHTTWDRFQDAREINDLFLAGGEYCDRLFAVLKERGIQAEGGFQLNDNNGEYETPLVIECQSGRIQIAQNQLPLSWEAVEELADEIEDEIAAKGGVIPRQ